MLYIGITLCLSLSFTFQISIFFSNATVPIGTKIDKNIHWIWSYLREFNKHALWEGKWKMAFYPEMQRHVSHSKLKSDQIELHAPLSSTRDIRKKAKYLGLTIRQDLK